MFDCRISTAAERRGLSDQVRGHAENIRGELDRHGLNSVPVVAVSSKWGLATRAAEPFEGPYRRFLNVRKRYAVADLDRWSNLPAFESVIVDLPQNDAKGLRLGALQGQLSGILKELDKKLGLWKAQSLASAQTLEKQIEGIFTAIHFWRSKLWVLVVEDEGNLRQPIANMLRKKRL